MKDQILYWFREHGGRLTLLLGMLLVGALSFEAGYFYRGTSERGSLVVTIPLSPVETERAPAVAGEAVTLPSIKPDSPTLPPSQRDCVYVGSKNSTKYHLATCAVAKRIKPENRLCFATKEEAEKRGYVASCLK